MNLYDFTVSDYLGNPVSLSKYKGKVLIVFNSATGCGYTPQYAGLEKLYETYKNAGLEILDFPCNQFLGQAPGSNQEIKAFCEMKYGVQFDVFAKVDVNGRHAAPLFQFLKEEAAKLSPKKKGFLFKLQKDPNAIKWNFTKFIIDRDGKVVKRVEPSTPPEEMTEDLKNLL